MRIRLRITKDLPSGDQQKKATNHEQSLYLILLSELTNFYMLGILFIFQFREYSQRRRSYFYRPRMRQGNVFILFVCVCVCVCLSVCVSVWAITFECLNIETSFLVSRYILTTSRSRLSIKVKVTLVKLASWTVGHQICFL